VHEKQRFLLETREENREGLKDRKHLVVKATGTRRRRREHRRRRPAKRKERC